LKPKNPRHHESDRSPKEENQNLETGKIICCYTPEIERKTKKTTSPSQKGREQNHLFIPKRTRKHHPFTFKELAKPEERKKFIAKQKLPQNTREKGSVRLPFSMHTLKKIFAFGGKKSPSRIFFPFTCYFIIYYLTV